MAFHSCQAIQGATEGPLHSVIHHAWPYSCLMLLTPSACSYSPLPDNYQGSCQNILTVKHDISTSYGHRQSRKSWTFEEVVPLRLSACWAAPSRDVTRQLLSQPAKTMATEFGACLDFNGEMAPIRVRKNPCYTG